MSKKNYIPILVLMFVSIGNMTWAQTTKKVSFVGNARSLFYGDKLSQDTIPADTITIPKLNSGHVLVDLGINVRPNSNTEILGMVRIRNDYGGFWGSGVSFDVRQLSVKGVVGGIVRYQLGDINYKMTNYTLWNNDQELISNTPFVFRQQTDLVNYDHFYSDDHSWRQQGAAAECALVFKKYIQEIQFHAVTTRVKTSDFSNVSDRLFSGLNAQIVQGKNLELGINYANLYDIPGTSRSKSTFHNPVLTGSALARVTLNNYELSLQAEAGKSHTHYRNNTVAPDWNDQFLDATLSVKENTWGIQLSGNTKFVGDEFRSPGAQTKRIDYNGVPAAYTRITNDQSLRNVTMLDLMRESSFYNRQLRPYLMDFSPAYDNITPFGDATPNRQGFIGKLKFSKKESPVMIEIAHAALQEVRGEGTKLPRKFDRNTANIQADINRFFSGWKKMAHVSVNYRSDKTTREQEELVKGVDLSTQVVSLGLELEVLPSFDLLMGWQNVEYKGFDYTAVRNTYSEIFNFSEYKVDGNETMTAFGLRYRFSERTFISGQWSNFKTSNALNGMPKYDIQQIMLLFQMKF